MASFRASRAARLIPLAATVPTKRFRRLFTDTKHGHRNGRKSAPNEVSIGEQHFSRFAVRQSHLRYQHPVGLGVYLRQYKPRTVWNFRKREIALCIALSPPDHVFQTGIGCLRGVGFASRGDHVPEHFTKIRCRWKQQDAVPSARRDTISFLPEKSLAAYAIFTWFRIGLMFRIIELRAHRHERWPILRHRLLTSRAPSVCERQAERYRSHSHDVFPEGCHFTYSDSAAGLISASTRSRNLRLTAKRIFRKRNLRPRPQPLALPPLESC
jgi:hypothetical protein